jgi:two-component system, OmpR family, sensor histidine kinase TctE
VSADSAAPGSATATPTCWHLVFSCDGTVLGATDGAPPAWTGMQLHDRDDVPQDLKDAGREVLHRARVTASSVAATVLLQSIHQPVHLTVVHALTLRREPTDLGARLRSNLEVLQQQAKTADIRLSLAVDDRVPAVVSVDAEKIAWAVTALVGNALRYVRHGTRTWPGGSISVRVTANPAGDEVTLVVQDDGPGIPPDKLSVMFSGGPGKSRAGLALCLIREIAAAHGGRVDIQSETDAFRHGTTIRLTLPVI